MSGMLLLALLIVVVSGLVAYIGDLIGRKMGRKRLTLFGLRPRHTAIVISVAAGMLIAILTLTAAFATSKAVRDAFVVPLHLWRLQLKDLNVALTRAQEDLSLAKEQAKETTDLLENKDRHLKEYNERLEKARLQLEQAQKHLKQTEKNLHAVKREVTGKQQELNARRIEVENSERIIKRKHKENAALEDDLRKKKEQIEALTVFFDANFTQLAFASGQEIVSGLMPTGITSKRRKELLQDFLTTAERIVRQQCHELSPQENAVVFLKADERDKKMVRIKEEEAIQRFSDRISRITEAREVILRLTPANNVPVNGQAFIVVDSIDIIPNSQVFKAGGEVARVEINVTRDTTRADILGRLVDVLLREQIPSALREKKMPMILRRFDPAHPQGVPNTSLSLVSWSDLMDATDKARVLSGKVSIVARCRKSTSLFDPLALTLEVVPSSK